MKTVLITGATGLVGTALLEKAPADFAVVATYYRNPFSPYANTCEFQQMDITDAAQVIRLLTTVKPEIVIHTAGITSVDYSQKHPTEARAANVDGTSNIIEACRQCNSHLIYISTNAVFDGKNPPYAEDHAPHPVNTYGQIKLACEQLVQVSNLPFSIVRPILMYGWPNRGARPNPLTWVVDSLRQGKRLNIVNDVFENPLLALSCAEAIWQMVLQQRNGVFHLGGRDVVSRYTFALLIADIFGLDQGLITAVGSDFFPEIAPRPQNTSYVTEKMQSLLGVRPVGLREGLIYLRDHYPSYLIDIPTTAGTSRSSGLPNK
jgi:dTDP-4-dehydrorhamnose reductase